MLRAAGMSHPGRKRRNNEDALLYDVHLGLAAVADGMGGHQSGEVASHLALEALQEFVAQAARDRDLTWPFGYDPARSFAANCLRTAIQLANRRVYQAAASREELMGMGTTLVAVLAHEGIWTYAGVGDSRAYLLRDSTLRQLTRDDSWIETAIAQNLVDAGDRHAHPLRHVLTKAIGLQEELEFGVGEEALRAGDRLLLCSDGLTAVVGDAEIRALLAQHEADLTAACGALVDAANAAGGPDNVTVVLLAARPR